MRPLAQAFWTKNVSYHGNVTEPWVKAASPHHPDILKTMPMSMPMSTLPESSPPHNTPVADAALLSEVAELVVSSLNLEIAAVNIQADDPLYGDGLGLDSIDILEIALVVSKRYGLQLRADQEDNTSIFQSLRSLGNHIAQQRTK